MYRSVDSIKLMVGGVGTNPNLQQINTPLYSGIWEYTKDFQTVWVCFFSSKTYTDCGWLGELFGNCNCDYEIEGNPDGVFLEPGAEFDASNPKSRELHNRKNNQKMVVIGL